ncbi:hypothetical protein TMatcc_006998 [Talaromyces marneffei ATCC 18224]
MASHKADASSFLDNRGYTGPLVRGVNPVTLFEKAVRDRITDSYYWKEQCFGLNAATLCDRAIELTSIGGTYGLSQKPTPFLCLAFKMLQLAPEKDIVLEYLNFTDPGSGDDENPEDAEINGEVDRVCATSLWKLPSRQMLEDLDLLEERVSPLADELEELDRESEASYHSRQDDDSDRGSDVMREE